ncbi:MAG TPA: flagellar hook capping FlgD N-terminal domain-containing protein [Sphingomonadaceae bacterium]|nr:flagellar hook capping FlgD N-terminal domain-containing protein [Sphingomonadaceae bacterium]
MTSIPATTDSSPGTASTASQNTITPDFNMFLQLLTAQMQNQDPLDPMDTAQYTQQLVQYSQVEQAMQQTGTLKSILANLSGQGMSQASAFIGREARFDTNIAGLDGSNPAQWTYAADQKPASLVATIKDATGTVVNTMTLDPASEGRFAWDGTKADGSHATDGAYALTLAAKDAQGADIPMTINSVGIVKDVVTDGSNVMLGVNGLRLSTTGLIAISTPASVDSGAG